MYASERIRSWRWPALMVVLVTAIGLALSWAVRPAPVPVRVRIVTPGRLRAYVDERGVTRVPRRYVISMPHDGRIQSLSVEEGDAVRAGQELASLVPRDMELELATAQAIVDRLNASLAENSLIALETTALGQTDVMIAALKATADAALQQKQAATAWLDYYRANAERIASLVRTSAESQDSLDMAEANRMASESELARQEKTVESQDLMVRAMQFMPQLIRDYLSRKALRGDVIRGELAEAEAKLELTRLRVERSVLKSPIDGIVLTRPVHNEQFLRSGTEVVTVGNMRELEIEAEVLTQDATRIQVGQRVEIYGQALGRDVDQGLAGHVRRVFPDAFTKVSSLGVEEQRTRVIVTIGSLDTLLKERAAMGVGYRVRVRIITETRDNVLAVPRSSLFRNDIGGWSLFVARDGRARRQDVGVGIMNDESAEVTSGIEAHDSVIVAPESALDEGTPVQPRELATPNAGGSE